MWSTCSKRARNAQNTLGWLKSIILSGDLGKTIYLPESPGIGIRIYPNGGLAGPGKRPQDIRKPNEELLRLMIWDM